EMIERLNTVSLYLRRKFSIRFQLFNTTAAFIGLINKIIGMKMGQNQQTVQALQ
ncbi:unnamed protein product, partial [Polarella glacialis]